VGSDRNTKKEASSFELPSEGDSLSPSQLVTLRVALLRTLAADCRRSTAIVTSTIRSLQRG
jgi:hypothetical protein